MVAQPANLSLFNRLPVFPLPGTVLFPGIVLPLHIFEPRHRDMIADALAADRAVGIVKIKTTPATAGATTLHDVGCVGTIIHAERLMGGRYNVLIQGQQRIRLVEEVPVDLSYRCFRAEVLPRPATDALEHASGELARLQSCVLSLSSSAERSDAQLLEVLRASSDPVVLADILSAALVPDAELQQHLLAATDLRGRLATLVDALAEVIVQMESPPARGQGN